MSTLSNLIVAAALTILAVGFYNTATAQVAIVVPVEEQGYKIDPDKDVNLVGKDFPYWIFDDKGIIRYCEEPEYYGQVTTPCWSYGVRTDCVILTPEEGYINCDAKENESEVPN